MVAEYHTFFFFRWNHASGWLKSNSDRSESQKENKCVKCDGKLISEWINANDTSRTQSNRRQLRISLNWLTYIMIHHFHCIHSWALFLCCAKIWPDNRNSNKTKCKAKIAQSLYTDRQFEYARKSSAKQNWHRIQNSSPFVKNSTYRWIMYCSSMRWMGPGRTHTQFRSFNGCYCGCAGLSPLLFMFVLAGAHRRSYIYSPMQTQHNMLAEQQQQSIDARRKQSGLQKANLCQI